MSSMSGLFHSFADKAQSAINATPLAGRVPNIGHSQRPASPDPASQPSANQAAAQGGGKSLALETISYQFRNLQQQYSTTTTIQRIITLEKGLSIDFENVSRDAKSQSKELYTWGQSEAEDIKDVSDRIAYLNFVQGALAATVAGKLETARGPLKALRAAEANLQPKRNIRTGIQTTIGRLESEQIKGNDKKVADMREALKKAEAEDEQLEKEVELLKRKALRESEQIKWDAIREYGEKLVLLSQAASPIIAALPTIPPSPANPYTGRDTTGAVRASLQRALDNYKTGHIHLGPHPAPSELSRSDTQSFGESHASELSSMYTEGPSPADPTPPKTEETDTGINPQTLNQSPAPIPAGAPAFTPGVAAAVKGEPTLSNTLPAVTPTIAETGIPVAAGPGGPGPARGSLYDIKAGSPAPVATPVPADPVSTPTPADPAPTPADPAPTPAASAPKHETAEEEKRRLAALYSSPPQAATTPVPATSSPAPPATTSIESTSSTTSQPQRYESAEEEKKRLEREERERLLHGNTPPDVPPKDDEPKDEELPPYQEPV